ncbi:hypothetical protein [Rhizobium leguminosarum]|uniref:hypothetical protein n=1 Tax=Rhizobium leguminosarum TaxID=384 RepID=UPI0019D4A50A|nr:hypothetical protein [Rhizobium leguminosarum]
MSASQNNFRRSRRFTYIALTLGLLSAAAICVTLVQVDALERDYGAVRSDIQRFNNERTEALGRRDGILSEISQRSVDVDGLRKTIADLAAERDRLTAEIKQQTASLSDGAQRLRAGQEQANTAADVIAAASQAEKTFETFRSQSAELEKKISVNQSRVDQTNEDVAQTEDKKRAADEALTLIEKTRRDREAEITRLNGQIEDLDDKQRQVADLGARQAALASQIAKMTKDLGDKQRESQDLDADIAKLQDQAAKAKVAAVKTDADMARQESSRADLAKEISGLETKKASLTGDLASLASSAERARSDVASAEGKAKAAQGAVAEAQKALPVLKAQLSDVQSEIAAAATRRDTLMAELAYMQGVRAKVGIDKSDADRASSEKTALDKAVAELTGRHAELAKELELRQSDLNGVKAELADLNGRKGALVQEIAAMSETTPSKPTVAVPDQPAADGQLSAPTQPAKP